MSFLSFGKEDISSDFEFEKLCVPMVNSFNSGKSTVKPSQKQPTFDHHRGERRKGTIIDLNLLQGRKLRKIKFLCIFSDKCRPTNRNIFQILHFT